MSEFLRGLLGGDYAGHRGKLQYNCTCYMKSSPIARPNSQPDITKEGVHLHTIFIVYDILICDTCIDFHADARSFYSSVRMQF